MRWPFLKAKKQKQNRPRRRVRARFDAAQTNAGNRRWWDGADALSARKANNPAVRKKLRERSRYESANNCYAKGIVKTLAEDTIGTGVRIQLTGFKSTKDAQKIEKEFRKYCHAIGLTEKLLTMRTARAVDGESFCIMQENPRLDTPVKMDLRLVETEMCCEPHGRKRSGIDGGDGVDHDAYGNPETYHILKSHPSDGGNLDWDDIKAEYVIHDFKPDRPGQVRGIPELTPGLPLFALMRGYSLATVEAAESIANFSAVAYTDSPAIDDEDGGGADEVGAFEEMPLERNVMTMLPRGWKLGQIKPEQPTGTYPEFMHENIGQLGRIFNMPFIAASGNSKGSSYAAGRMDYQIYHKSIMVDRSHIERVTLDRLFFAWLREAILIEGYLPQSARSIAADWSRAWMWDGWEHVDPQKSANAIAIQLANHTITHADVYGAKGQDWEERFEMIAKIDAKKRQLTEQYGIQWDSESAAESAKAAAEAAQYEGNTNE